MRVQRLQRVDDEMERLEVYMRDGTHIILEETPHLIAVRGYHPGGQQKFTQTGYITPSPQVSEPIGCPCFMSGAVGCPCSDAPKPERVINCSCLSCNPPKPADTVSPHQEP